LHRQTLVTLFFPVKPGDLGNFSGTTSAPCALTAGDETAFAALFPTATRGSSFFFAKKLNKITPLV
jgi:hypothetical protein